LWWLSVDTGETVIIFDDSQIIGYGAKWSPDGQWLSYVAPGSQGVQAYNVVDGRSFVIPSRMGSVAVWSPNSEALLVTDVQRSNDGGFAVHLLRARPESGELIDISGEGEAIEDTSPVWSPDGQWLALTRKTAGESMGKQVWLMRPDGSEARSLTDEPEAHHAFPAWSPDGRHLVYQRFPLKELNVQPAIWLMNIETGEARELIVPGNRPLWLP
jgi:TolB protein